MNNFIYENKTKVYFGKGGVKEYLGSVLKHYGSNVMLAYGSGSVKKNGVYDEVMEILKIPTCTQHLKTTKISQIGCDI